MSARRQKLALDGALFATITFLCWGMTGVWVRLIDLPPIFVVGVRMSIGWLGLLPFVFATAERRERFMATARMPVAWLLATALTFYYMLAVAGFALGTVAEVALFVGSSPAFIFVTRAWKRQPLSRREVVGALVAASGVLIVLAPRLIGSSAAASRLLGDLLALSAASTSAFYAATFRDLHERQLPSPDAISVALIACGVGGGLLTIAGTLQHPSVLNAASQHRWSFLGLGLLSTAIPSVTYALAARKLPAVLSTTSQLMIPVVATIAAAIILHERPPLFVYFGGLIIIYGILHMFQQDAPPFAEGEEPLAD